MTKIAIISDIHGNLPALNAVIKDMSRLGIDRIVVDGDLVGRGPQSREILDVITAKGWDVVKGNHEEFWAQCGQGTPPRTGQITGGSQHACKSSSWNRAGLLGWTPFQPRL